MSCFRVRDLGLLPYQTAFDIQVETVDQVQAKAAPNTLLLVEHPPVITLGANFHAENLLYSIEWYAEHGIDVQKTGRGGDVSYHGPGQLVAYPIFSLEASGRDLHKWLRHLEQAVIVALAAFDISGTRMAPHTGVWVQDRKICAMGIKVRRWVSMLGLALNCNVDLRAFESIIPCGIKQFGVTSLSEELERDVPVREAKPALVSGFETVFNSANYT